MSYARFGWDGSDVYVYGDVSGCLTCSACALNGTVEADPESILGVRFPSSWNTPTTGPAYDPDEPERLLPSESYHEMLLHLSTHMQAGHRVPTDAFLRLRREMVAARSAEKEK